ncbi:MAG: hypothetical protein K6F20_04105, partial [Bacteroidaceae bacterium]|nr:hypothetical protein [Bacteroidaceae bacterium]
MRKLLFLAFGIALEINAQVYTGGASAEVPDVCDFEPILTEGRTWNYVVHDTYTMADYCHSLQVGGDTIASDIPCKKILYIQDGKVQLH